jgi:hypothetical protein
MSDPSQPLSSGSDSSNLLEHMATIYKLMNAKYLLDVAMHGEVL